MSFVERYYRSADGLRLYYRDYPNASPKTPVLCIPGVTRNTRDFEFIAERISRDRRVLATDLRGRGRSDYDPNPANYLVPVETADIMVLMAQAGLPRVIVLGTSRGGIIAMALATAKPGSVAGAILNDIGPEIEPEGLARIAQHIGREPQFANWEEAVEFQKLASAESIFGVSDDKWLTFTKARMREDNGKIVPDYDPKLAMTFQARAAIRTTSADLWLLFNALIPVPVLVLRGENSRLLSEQGLRKMRAVKPDLVTLTIKDRGHVPFLDEPEAVAAIDGLLQRVP